MRSFRLYEQPLGKAVELAMQPRLESWERSGHPAQVALGAYLDHVEVVVDGFVHRHAGKELALSLGVGLAPEAKLIGSGGDLDNYLYPVVPRLGAARFASAWAVKRHGRSRICVQPAVFGGSASGRRLGVRVGAHRPI